MQRIGVLGRKLSIASEESVSPLAVGLIASGFFTLGYGVHAAICWLIHGEQLAAFRVWVDSEYVMPKYRRAERRSQEKS